MNPEQYNVDTKESFSNISILKYDLPRNERK